MTSHEPGRASAPAGLPARVKIAEMGPRDGLQNERAAVPAAVKIAYVDALTASGLPLIEVTSFVRPDAVPQLADAEAVLAGIRRAPGVLYPSLVPNVRGLARARAAGCDAIAVFTAASDGFARRNVGMDVETSLRTCVELVREARAAGMWTRAYVSTAFGCPFDGPVDPEAVARVAERLAETGVDEISIGDTIGVAVPTAVTELVTLLQERLPVERLAMHFHDTRGAALANVLAAMAAGVATFDAASGGYGGCPFAPGATGNLATEDLVLALHGMGVETGVDLGALRAATRLIAAALGRRPDSRAFRALEAADAAGAPGGAARDDAAGAAASSGDAALAGAGLA